VSRSIILPGKKFGRLTVIEPTIYFGRGSIASKLSASKCLCSCGNNCIVLNKLLKNGGTKSCGCYSYESSLKQIKNNRASIKKYNEFDAIIIQVFNLNYSDGDLSLQDFYKLSNKNCFYCGSMPSNIQPHQTYKYLKFIYSGLDRINSNKNHSKENVVPCCKICNKLKLNMSFDQFKKHVNNLINKNLYDPYHHRSLSEKISPNFLIYPAINKVYCRYNDGDLLKNDFYKLSQLDCFYCDKKSNESNCIIYSHPSKKYEIRFNYNGIDRINNYLGHYYENSVSCCKYCNSGKGILKYDEFINYISKLRSNFYNWKDIKF
jgi:5-methylcytosine-specific restriction endonuclease McrA